MAQPTVFSVSATHFAEDGYVHVTWTGAPSTNHYSYRVYRLDPEATEWKLVKERADTAANYTYDDYFAPAGRVFYAVVEVTAVASVQTEETKAPRMVTLVTDYYWLLDPNDNSKHFKFRNVKSEEFHNERDTDIKKLIGRGRKVDVGDDWGKTGSLSGVIYDTEDKTARQIRLDMEASRDTNDYHYLRNPFGDVWKIWWEDPQFSRIPGVGKSEFVEMSFSYYEVA